MRTPRQYFSAGTSHHGPLHPHASVPHLHTVLTLHDLTEHACGSPHRHTMRREPDTCRPPHRQCGNADDLPLVRFPLRSTLTVHTDGPH
eukprot:355425-Chlamydomonas_euryale.AAC.9